MCGSQLTPPDASFVKINDGLPVLELPKSVAVNSLSCKRASLEACSSPRQCSTDQLASKVIAHTEGQPAARTGLVLGGSSPLVSPRSACSTPGGADNSMGIQLHALVFSKQRQNEQQQQVQRRSRDARGASSFSSGMLSQQQQLVAGARPRTLPARNRTSHDLRLASQDNSTNPWASYSSRSGGHMLNSIAALGLHSSPTTGSTGMQRGSISKAKLVLAEAINSVPGAHGLSDFSPATCDTGVLSPLLTIIKQNGCVSRRSSFSEVASSASSCSSSSTACGFACGSSTRCLHAASGARCCGSRLARCSSSGEGEEPPCIPPTVSEHGPAPDMDATAHAELLAQQQQRQRTAHMQKVVDCIDTVKYLSMDDSNRMALIDLGAVELLLSKLQHSAKPAPEVAVAALGALSAICKHDTMKQQLWDNPDSAVILQLVSSRQGTAEVRAAHQAASKLAWSVDGCTSTSCTSGNGSVFDSISSGQFSSADSVSSSCSGANMLLEPALIPALAEALHPAADVPVLLSALRLLNKAAGSIEPEVPAPPLSTGGSSSGGSSQQSQQRQRSSGWHKVLFSLMPLLISTHRRQGHLVLNSALELLVVLTEQHQELHSAVCIAGCLPPLLAQVLDGNSEQSLQAACILTGIVDTPAAQERLAQEPALAVLLRVLQNSKKSVDVRLAAVHMLRRLAASTPRCVTLLKMQAAVPAVVSLLREVHDSDVRHAAAGLLNLLGTPVVVRCRRSSDKNGAPASSGPKSGSIITIAASSSSLQCSGPPAAWWQQERQCTSATHSQRQIQHVSLTACAGAASRMLC